VSRASLLVDLPAVRLRRRLADGDDERTVGDEGIEDEADDEDDARESEADDDDGSRWR
jgi:hypothetical protein